MEINWWMILVGIGAWAIKAFLDHRLASTAATSAATAAKSVDQLQVDLKLAGQSTHLEALIRELHAENLKTNQVIASDLKEIAALLYGARGGSGMAEEVAYNQVVREGILQHLQALETWVTQVQSQPGMPPFHSPPPVERRHFPRDT